MIETLHNLNPEFDEIADQMPDVQARGDQLLADTTAPEAVPFGAEMFQDIPQALGGLTANETLFSVNEETAKGKDDQAGGRRGGGNGGNGGSGGNGGGSR